MRLQQRSPGRGCQGGQTPHCSSRSDTSAVVATAIRVDSGNGCGADHNHNGWNHDCWRDGSAEPNTTARPSCR